MADSPIEVDDRAALHDKLDELSTAAVLVRQVYEGPLPPAPPPNEFAVWDPYEGLWVETDAHMRERAISDRFASGVGAVQRLEFVADDPNRFVNHITEMLEKK